MTGVVFCALLAPFAADYGYRTWTLSSVLTHALTPMLAILDFFLDTNRLVIENKHVLLCSLPPILYFSISFLLEIFNVDFGRGVAYPYFFMNFRSPAGVFGFSTVPPFFMGTFYWFLLFPALLFGIATLFKRLHNKRITA